MIAFTSNGGEAQMQLLRLALLSQTSKQIRCLERLHQLIETVRMCNNDSTKSNLTLSYRIALPLGAAGIDGTKSLARPQRLAIGESAAQSCRVGLRPTTQIGGAYGGVG